MGGHKERIKCLFIIFCLLFIFIGWTNISLGQDINHCDKIAAKSKNEFAAKYLTSICFQNKNYKKHSHYKCIKKAFKAKNSFGGNILFNYCLGNFRNEISYKCVKKAVKHNNEFSAERAFANCLQESNR